MENIRKSAKKIWWQGFDSSTQVFFLDNIPQDLSKSICNISIAFTKLQIPSFEVMHYSFGNTSKEQWRIIFSELTNITCKCFDHTSKYFSKTVYEMGFPVEQFNFFEIFFLSTGKNSFKWSQLGVQWRPVHVLLSELGLKSFWFEPNRNFIYISWSMRI
jgi:hypothetical protein